nr:BamA/TamA family outer membrane protein [Segetibacter sp.]
NQINVLAGFLPSNQQVGGKLLLTVDANLQLQNAFGTGESVGLVWQQIQPKSPRFHFQYTQPYLFNSPFGIDFLFELYKKDSSFLNINAQFGLLYMLSPNKTGKVTLQTLRTNVLDVDTFRVKAFKRLPDIADVSSINLGMEYDIANTNYRFNPGSGNEVTIAASAGNKSIRKNSAIIQIKDPSFNYNRLYDTVKLKTYQLRLRLKAAQYFSVGKQAVLKAGVNAGWFESPSFFRNELFQIGGYKLLRGFDEESIFANKYAVGTFEYRYLVGLNSNFFVFSDFGLSDNKIIKQTNNYISAGAGLSFETKGGIFNISYAAGKRNDLSFDIKQSKIHFGYVSIF